RTVTQLRRMKCTQKLQNLTRRKPHWRKCNPGSATELKRGLLAVRPVGIFPADLKAYAPEREPCLARLNDAPSAAWLMRQCRSNKRNRSMINLSVASEFPRSLPTLSARPSAQEFS